MLYSLNQTLTNLDITVNVNKRSIFDKVVNFTNIKHVSYNCITHLVLEELYVLKTIVKLNLNNIYEV